MKIYGLEPLITIFTTEFLHMICAESSERDYF